jgi:hypothetical protein
MEANVTTKAIKNIEGKELLYVEITTKTGAKMHINVGRKTIDKIKDLELIEQTNTKTKK